jgi:transposase InsO family protein
MVKGLNIKGTTTIPSTSVCSGCVFGKLKRHSFPTKPDHPREDRRGVRIHADVCGPMSQTSCGGSKYFILFKDDASCYRFVYCVQHKSEALQCFKTVNEGVQQLRGTSIIVLRTNNGTEFCNQAFQTYVNTHCIKHEFTLPYNSHQNGAIKRDNRTVMEMAKSVIHQARVSIKFWAEAVCYSVYTLNCTGKILLRYTPYQIFT